MRKPAEKQFIDSGLRGLKGACRQSVDTRWSWIDFLCLVLEGTEIISQHEKASLSIANGKAPILPPAISVARNNLSSAVKMNALGMAHLQKRKFSSASSQMVGLSTTRLTRSHGLQAHVVVELMVNESRPKCNLM